MNSLKKLKLWSLTLLITGAIDSIRNLPAAALFGDTLIFFFIFSAIVFLIPTALVSAELSAHIDQGGIYQWAKHAFGKKTAFLAVWLQWVNNLIWFPTILSFIAGTAAFLIDPSLAQNKFFLVITILATFWFLTLINLRGIRLSAKFTSFCAIIGLLIPIALIIVLLIVWLIMGKPIQLHFTAETMLPSFKNSDSWFGLTAIMLGFTGMELATVHIKDVENPKKTFPKALAISTFLILSTMLLGSLAIAMVLPMAKINLVNGTIETFSYYLNAYHLQWLTPLLTVFLVVGSLGGVISWVVSPIKGLNQAAKDGFLPPVLEKLNKYQVPQNLLLLQAMLVSLVCLVFLLFPTVNASYWLLTDLSTQLYVLMYIIMFLTAFKLRNKMPFKSEHFTIPGKALGRSIVSTIGLLGCALTLIVGFIPPTNMNISSNFYYEAIFIMGLFIMISPILFFYWYSRIKK